MPTRKLPPELLSHVFTMSMPDDAYTHPFHHTVPLALTLVCRRWRHVAISTPALWCFLTTASLGSGDPQPRRIHTVRGVQRWLSRSGNRPLSIQFPFDDAAICSQEWLHLLQSYTPRFQRLHVVCGVETDLTPLLQGTDRLQHLVVEAGFQEGTHTIAMSRPPSTLHTLVINFIAIPLPTFPTQGWANLKRLAVRLPINVTCSLDKFLALIDRFPNLARLAFDKVTVQSPHIHTRSYPNIRSVSLVLDNLLDDDIVPATAIHFPSLGDLGLVWELGTLEDVIDPIRWDFPPEWVRQHYRPFGLQVAAREGPSMHIFNPGWVNMTHLAMAAAGEVSGKFHTVLRLCPSLQALQVTGQDDRQQCTAWDAVTHACLTSLDIMVQAELNDLLDTVTLPCLRELKISCASRDLHRGIRSFLQRSRCPLEVLEVTTKALMVWSEEEREELAQQVPALTRIALYEQMY